MPRLSSSVTNASHACTLPFRDATHHARTLSSGRGIDIVDIELVIRYRYCLNGMIRLMLIRSTMCKPLRMSTLPLVYTRVMM